MADKDTQDTSDVVDLGGGWRLQRLAWGKPTFHVWAIVAPDHGAIPLSDNAYAMLRDLVARWADALAVLREIEWGYGVRWTASCVTCYNEREEGHAPDCIIAAALADDKQPEGGEA